MARRWPHVGFLTALTVVGSAVLIPLWVAPAGATESAPPAGRVTIEVVTVKGTGCKKDSAVAAISPDKEAFTVTYSTYLAHVGADVKNRESKKGCKIDVKVSIPPGSTYTIGRADYFGFASLAAGATAMQRAKYKFQGTPDKAHSEHGFRGPFEDNWQTTDFADPASQIFGACGKARTINIDTELRVNAGTSDPETSLSMIAMDATDSVINTIYRFTWKTC